MSLLKAAAGFRQFQSAPGGGDLEWAPQQLGSDVVLGVWLPYHNSDTVTESAGAITQIDDLSGNNFHLGVTGNGNSPNYNGATNNVEFDENNTEGLFADMLTGDANEYDVNLFAVFEPISSGLHDQWITPNNNSRNNASDAGLAWALGGTGIRVWKSNSPRMNYDPGNRMFLYHVQTNQTSGGFIRDNGVTVATTPDLFGAKVNQLCFASDNATADFVTMNLRGAVMTKGGLTTDNYERIEAWLADKCGLMGDLDAGHTYKDYTFTKPTNGWTEVALSTAEQYTEGLTWLGGDSYNWTGAGADLHATDDRCVFYYKLLGDDITIDSYIESFSLISGDQVGPEQYAGVYLMVRETLDANSVHYSVGANLTALRIQQKRRTSTNGSTQESNIIQNPPIPLYLRTVRASGVVTQYYSLDGISYTQIGDAPNLGTGDLYIGIAVVSHDDSASDYVSAKGTITIT